MAVEALGKPRMVATEWSRALQSERWTARHPWLTGSMGFCGIWVFYVLIFVASFYLSGAQDCAVTHRLRFLPPEGWLFLVNWMPWVFGMTYLIWRAVWIPSGWKALFVGCLALGLATSAFAINGHPPFGGPKTGNLTINVTTWTSLWVIPLCYWLHMLREIGFYQEAVWWRCWVCPGLFKLIFPLVACWVARWITIRSSNLTTLDGG